MDLTRDLHKRPTALAIVRSMVELCRTLGTELVAEGVETVNEYVALRACGIRLMQGYLLAKPGFERLPRVSMPGSDAVEMAELDVRGLLEGGAMKGMGGSREVAFPIL